MSTEQLFDVTYFNHLKGERCVLIDALDKETADAVAAKWGNPDEPNFFMPEIRIEARTTS